MNNVDRSTKAFNIVSFLIGLGWLFLGSSLLAFPLYIIGPKVSGLPFEEYIQNIQLVTEHSYVVACVAHVVGIIFFVLFFKTVIKDDAKLFKNKVLKSIVIIVAGSILLYFSSWLLDIIYKALGFSENDTSANQQAIVDALNGSTKYFVIFYTVILAPIFEEIVFRKLFYNALKSVKLPVWAIVLIIASAFALLHVMTDIESLVFFPQYFVLSLIITLSYAISKENLFVSTGLHFVNNLMAVIQIL